MQGTYPLDTLRLRLAVDPGSSTMRGAAAALLREGSNGAFFRGLGTGLAGVTPGLRAEGSVPLVLRAHLPPGSL